MSIEGDGAIPFRPTPTVYTLMPSFLAISAAVFGATIPVLLEPSVNNMIRKILPRLTEKFNVLHLCGKGKLDETLVGTKGYFQMEYAKDEMKDLFAYSEIVVSRAGANAICEFLALHKPNLLIPLPLSASRGDQLLNAESFRKQGFSLVLDEDKDLTEDSLYETICRLYDEREEFRKVMLKSDQKNAVSSVMKLIEENSLK